MSAVVVLLCRLAVGGVFIYASLDKLAHPQAFAEAIHHYRLVPYALLHPSALLLPMVEFVLGAALVLGIARRGASLWAAFLLVVFTIAIGTGGAAPAGSSFVTGDGVPEPGDLLGTAAFDLSGLDPAGDAVAVGVCVGVLVAGTVATGVGACATKSWSGCLSTANPAAARTSRSTTTRMMRVCLFIG